MFSVPGIVSQASMIEYNDLILSHYPLLFVPLGVNYQTQVGDTVVYTAYSSETLPELSFTGTKNLTGGT